MQQNSPSHIELIWPNGKSYILNILQLIDICRPDQVVSFLKYLLMQNRKPTHFIWHDPEARPVTPKMRKWVDETFPLIFDTSDRLLLFASIGTAPKELRNQLQDLFNEQIN